ncbi:RAB6-interacting golgin isoform X3 [Festucalex cinctus]
MSGWAGFSEDEMRKLQQKDSVVASKRKVRPSCGNRQQLQTESILKRAVQANAGFEYIELPPEQRLNKPPMKGECCEAIAPGGPAVQCDAQQSAREEKTQEKCEEADEKRNPEVKEPGKQEMELISFKTNCLQCCSRDKTRLEQLHRDQKIIEERNKRKKALLAKTIAEKSKQTQAEAVKLKRIQKELQALDDMVSNDIDILRGKIEQASWDYTTASACNEGGVPQLRTCSALTIKTLKGLRAAQQAVGLLFAHQCVQVFSAFSSFGKVIESVFVLDLLCIHVCISASLSVVYSAFLIVSAFHFE